MGLNLFTTQQLVYASLVSAKIYVIPKISLKVKPAKTMNYPYVYPNLSQLSTQKTTIAIS